jgi:hypothetical protein
MRVPEYNVGSYHIIAMNKVNQLKSDPDLHSHNCDRMTQKECLKMPNLASVIVLSPVGLYGNGV